MRMPNNAAFPPCDMAFCRFNTKELIVATGLFYTRIENNKIMDNLQQARFVTHATQVKIEFMFVWVGAIFLPLKVVLFWCLNRAVTQALRVVTRHHQLHGGEEVTDKIFLLVIEVLANPFRDRHRRAFQLNHAQSNTVNIQHYVWAFFVFTLDRDFFGNGKIVCFWVFPVNQPHGFIKMASTFFIFHAVTQ